MSGPIVLVLRAVLALFLYGFLVWGLTTLWRNVRQQGTLLARRKTPPINLTIQSEKLPPQVRRFTRAEIIIGRDPSSDCPLEDDAASAQHVRLSYHHGQWWAEDIHSTNGTLLNNHRITMPTVIISDDEITCGQTRITIGLADYLLNPPTTPLHPPAEKE
jgi:pSer/pThr/pTyr-binding forkhead associated (FHA) protein